MLFYPTIFEIEDYQRLRGKQVHLKNQKIIEDLGRSQSRESLADCLCNSFI